MPTQKPRFSIAMDYDLLQAVDDYKFENRVKSQNQAINDLVRAGIEELKRREASQIEKASESAEADTKALGKDTVQVFKDILGRAGMLNDNQDISDNDLEFLKAMFLAMKAHFKDSNKRGE